MSRESKLLAGLILVTVQPTGLVDLLCRGAAALAAGVTTSGAGLIRAARGAPSTPAR